MEELEIGAKVKVRCKKDLLCMYRYPDISGQKWMKSCGTVSRIKSSSKQFVTISDQEIYGWGEDIPHKMYTLVDLPNLQFFADDLELVED